MNGPKASPQQVAQRTIAGIEAGTAHVLGDDAAEMFWRLDHEDRAGLTGMMEEAWVEGSFWSL